MFSIPKIGPEVNATDPIQIDRLGIYHLTEQKNQ